MIPKKIHYCWLGDKEKTELVLKCIKSWKKYCPDYEIIEWSEQNINLKSVPYMEQAYDAKAWGFVPDVARLQIIYNHGGIYLDTDVEIIRTFDDLLNNHAFVGRESGDYVNLGSGFGAEPNNQYIKLMLDAYNDLSFRLKDGSLNRIASPKIQTDTLKKIGLKEDDILQNIGNLTVYTKDYFSPIDYYTGLCEITDNTHSIHHYDGSWLTESERKEQEQRLRVMKKYGKRFGKIIWVLVKFIAKIKNDGLCNTIGFCISKITDR